jgi:diphthamide biosynthesis protein 7
MFSNPAEVWSACFAKEGNGDIVLSGGDEGNLKIWDLRCPTSRPRQVLKPFDAGVTVVSAHPRLEHMVACGSYDETMCLIDLRFMSPQRPMFRSEPLGGGIWRIQWHPYNDDRILLAAMHGGCRIVQMNNVNIPSNESKPWISVVNEFTKHESMAYGADWLVWKDAEHDKCFDAAASCSFYDRAAYIWSAVDYQY